jgi:hypothetical protein
MEDIYIRYDHNGDKYILKVLAKYNESYKGVETVGSKILYKIDKDFIKGWDIGDYISVPVHRIRPITEVEYVKYRLLGMLNE